MAQNRKHQSAAVRFGPTLKVLLLCLFVGGSGVGYVWQKNQLVRLSRRLKQVERETEAARVVNQELNRQMVHRVSPAVLDAKVRELKLGLGPVSPTNTIFLIDRPAEGGVSDADPMTSQPPSDPPLPLRGLASRH